VPLSGITQYVYDQAGHLLAESDDAGNTLTEYVWLDDMPIALVANVNTSPTLYFVHTDHLNRPIMMTDANKAIVWQADYNPFGAVNSITGSATNNLRFPGQYFLIEDGLHYNWYRHYDPTVGRYIQPDPLGFVNGPSVYEYATSNPLQKVDPNGQQWIQILRVIVGAGAVIIDNITEYNNNSHYSGQDLPPNVPPPAPPSPLVCTADDPSGINASFPESVTSYTPPPQQPVYPEAVELHNIPPLYEFPPPPVER
jgi:RHS repeat-associated protein